MERSQLSWFGHIIGMPPGHLPLEAWRFPRMSWKRLRGRGKSGSACCHRDLITDKWKKMDVWNTKYRSIECPTVSDLWSLDISVCHVTLVAWFFDLRLKHNMTVHILTICVKTEVCSYCWLTSPMSPSNLFGKDKTWCVCADYGSASVSECGQGAWSLCE